MATNPYTATYLLAQIRRQGFIPGGGGSGSSLTDADLCAMVNDEAQLYLTALIKSVREDHLEVTEDITIVAGTASYRVNRRAVANSLTAIFTVASGQPAYPLTQLAASQAWALGTTGDPRGFEMFGPAIVLHPTPITAGTLRVRYLQRLSRVVPEAEVGRITVVDTLTNTVTVSATPTAIVTGVVCDLVRGDPPFDNLSIDLTATVSGTSITLSALPTGLAVGDYVTLAGETPIPQVPPELHQLLAKRVAYVVAGGTTSPNAAALQADIEVMRTAALTLLTPRVSHASRPIVNRNGPGFGRFVR